MISQGERERDLTHYGLDVESNEVQISTGGGVTGVECVRVDRGRWEEGEGSEYSAQNMKTTCPLPLSLSLFLPFT